MYSKKLQKAKNARPAVNTTSRLFKQVVSFPHIAFPYTVALLIPVRA